MRSRVEGEAIHDAGPAAGVRLRRLCRTLLSLATALTLFTGCAKEREVRAVVADSYRLRKSELGGDFFFLKSVVDVVNAGPNQQYLAPGRYLEADRVVRFDIKDDTLDILSQEPILANDEKSLRSPLLARFKVKSIDVMRKQNEDGKDTHEEELTETRRTPREREYIVVETASDRVGDLGSKTASAAPVGSMEWDPNQGALNFVVEHTLEDQTTMRVRYSFLRYHSPSTFVPRVYSVEDQKRFGFFKTTLLGKDRYLRYSRSARVDLLNRWDTHEPVRFHLSEGFPSHLADEVEKIFADQNRVFEKVIGKPLLVLERTPSPYPLGDLRANHIVYDTASDIRHTIQGYGPLFSDPRTGRIVKGDVIFYAGTLGRARLSGRLIENVFNQARRTAHPSGLIDGALQQLFGTPQTSNLFTTPAPKQLPDAQWLQNSIERAGYSGALKRLQDEMTISQAQRSTFLSDTYLFEAHTDSAYIGLSDAEFEHAMFIPLANHEMLHSVGLRHNYMGSADHGHLDKEHKKHGKQSTSALDYLLRPSQQLDDLGPYDEAAITFGYSDNEAIQEGARREGFLFCTDEQLFQSRRGLCHQFDTGSTLTEFIDQQVERYRASFFVNNLRNDDLFFSADDDVYEDRIYRLLLPIRQAYDHAQAILTAAQMREDDPRRMITLWSLLGLRIEEDKNSRPMVDGDGFEVHPPVVELAPVLPPDFAWPEGVPKSNGWRHIDPRKLDDALMDAQRAVHKSFNALKSILLESNRNEYTLPHPSYDDEAEIRGVLVDKIIALRLLLAPTPNPIVEKTSITMYDGPYDAPPLRDLIASILSSTIAKQNSRKQIFFANLNLNPALRSAALEILSEELLRSAAAPGARAILTSEKVEVPPADLRRSDRSESPARLWLGEMLDQVPINQVTEARRFAEVFPRFGIFSALDMGFRCLTNGRCPLPPTNRLGHLLEQAKAATAERNRGPFLGISSLGRIEKRRRGIRSVYANFYRSQFEDNRSKERTDALEQQLQDAEAFRNEIEEAFSPSDANTLIRAPMRVASKGLRTATGHLIRDRINRIEDRLLAIQEVLMEKLGGGDVDGRTDETAQQLEISKRRLEMELEEEKLLLELIYGTYELGPRRMLRTAPH